MEPIDCTTSVRSRRKAIEMELKRESLPLDRVARCEPQDILFSKTIKHGNLDIAHLGRGNFGKVISLQPLPFVRNELVIQYDTVLQTSPQKLVVITGEHGVGKSRMINEWIQYLSKNSDKSYTFHQCVSVDMLDQLTEIRARDLCITWIQKNVPTLTSEPTSEPMAAWKAAVERTVPPLPNDGRATIVLIEDAAGYRDTAIAITKELLSRSNTTVTFSIPADREYLLKQIPGDLVVTFPIHRYDEREATELAKKIGNLETPFRISTEKMRQLLLTLFNHPLAMNQAVSLHHAFYERGDHDIDAFRCHLTGVAAEVLSWEEHCTIGAFPDRRETVATLATISLLLKRLNNGGDVARMSVRLLRILVVMRTPLVPVHQLYYIITCTEGSGFQDREPFHDAINLLKTVSAVRMKCDRIEVYRCVRDHPAFLKDKEELRQYLRSDLRLSLQFLQFVQTTMNCENKADHGIQGICSAMHSSVPCPSSSVRFGETQEEESNDEKKKEDGGEERHNYVEEKVDAIQSCIPEKLLTDNNCLKTSVFGVAKELMRFVVFLLAILLISYIAYRCFVTPVQSPTPVDQEEDLNGVVTKSQPQTGPTITIPCPRPNVSALVGLKQVELTSPMDLASFHEAIKMAGPQASNLLLDVDTLCECISADEQSGADKLESVELGSIRKLHITNCQRCPITFWKFKLSFPNLTKLTVDNCSLTHQHFEAFRAFVSPSMATLQYVAFDRSSVTDLVVDLFKKFPLTLAINGQIKIL